MDPVNTGGEGGYVVCKNFIRQSSAIVNVGINGFDAFGCAVSTIGGFENAQYDCINPTPTDCPSNKGRNHIHKVCLGTETENHLGQ